MGTEATLIYNMWIFSYLINLIRRLTGVIWGFAGRVIYLALDTFDTQVGHASTVSKVESISLLHIICNSGITWTSAPSFMWGLSQRHGLPSSSQLQHPWTGSAFKSCMHIRLYIEQS